MRIKKVKFSKKTATVKFECDSMTEKQQLIALALISGNYNPLRKYSSNDKPIDIEQMNEYTQKLEDLLFKVYLDTNVKPEEYPDIKEIG